MLERRLLDHDVAVLVAPRLESQGFLIAFSERGGGVSDPPFRGLNLGLKSGDDPERVRENRRRLIAAGFDKLGPGLGDASSRLSRLLEAPSERDEERIVLPSLLEDEEEEDEIFKSAPETVVFDAEEDLDIPDFLKS